MGRIGIGPVDPHVIIYVPSSEEMVKTALAVKNIVEKKNPNIHVQVIIIPERLIPYIATKIANQEPLEGEYEVLRPLWERKIVELYMPWVYEKESNRLMTLEEYMKKIGLM